MSHLSPSDWFYFFLPEHFLNRPKVKREKKSEDRKVGLTSAKDIKSKVAPRIDTNIVKLKLLEASRKAIMNNLKRQVS